LSARVIPFPQESVTTPNKWVVALSIGFGSLMATIDSSIVNVALPNIRGTVGATIEEITWISTAYIIAMVIVMPLTGFLGAFFGQKRVYLASLVLFVLGSMLCGVARTLPMLVFYRVIQGLGAGSLQPTQQAILRQTFPAKEQGMAMALFSMIIMVGPAIGPTLGGWIVDNYSWPWIFYINVPVGVLGVFMTWRYVIEPEDVLRANRDRAEAMRKNLDVAGIVLMCVGVCLLQYVLEEGQRDDWFESKTITALSAIAVVSLVAFVIRELTAPVPVVDLRLFRDRTFAAGTAIAGVMFAMLMGSMFLLPVFMQELLGFNAMQSGLVLMPRTIAMMVITPIIGKLYNHVAPAIVVAIGALLFVLGSWQLSHITLASSSGDIMLPMIVTGAGLACLFVPLTTAALTFIPRGSLADASGLNSFVRQIGGSLGLTIFATLLGRYQTRANASLAEHVSNVRPEATDRISMIAHGMMARGQDAIAAQHMALAAVSGSVRLQAAVLAFEKTFLLQAVAFVIVLPLLYFLRVSERKAPNHIEMSIE